jgi:hypothetical protein
MKTLQVDDLVIIKKGSSTLHVPAGAIGRVTNVKQIQGSKLLPGQDVHTYKVQLVTVLTDGKSLLFGDELEKVVEVRLAGENEQPASLKQAFRISRLYQHALRYRREWRKARKELVTLSEALAAKDIEVQQMRAANALARENREQAEELARGIQESTDKAASVTESVVAHLEQANTALRSEVLNLKKAADEVERDTDTKLQRARKPVHDAICELHTMGYDGDLMDMLKALYRDLEMYRNAYNGMVKANAETGKIIEVEFAGSKKAAPAS